MKKCYSTLKILEIGEAGLVYPDAKDIFRNTIESLKAGLERIPEMPHLTSLRIITGTLKNVRSDPHMQ